MKRNNFIFLVVNIGWVALLYGPSLALAGPSYLGTAQNFAVLGGSTVTCTGATIVTGDLGVSPGAAITGFPVPCTDTGTIHTADATALTAQNDLTTAYNALASQPCNLDLTGQDLGTVGTLTPGVYCFSSSAQLTGTLTLNALGNPNAVFIFKMGSTLTTASNASVSVINGGSDCGVSWQVGSSATLGTNTALKGNIVALTSITLNTGASVSGGRALARNGAVTLDTNAVSSAVCAGFAAAGLPGPGSGVPVVAGAIPTLSEWAMITLAALLTMFGFVALRRYTV
ncbi:MAG TPA: IPTL-CTERM sorting domain-containing protein [Gammaproteobacteria bacterium]|nr:IPTL-CTERM sorting domain-containing protein [Gammaproteobacteria bacterium]